MPRQNSIASDVLKSLKSKPDGLSMGELQDAIRRRRGDVLQHSVRSAVYAHLGDKGERLFRREGSGRSGRYFAR